MLSISHGPQLIEEPASRLELEASVGARALVLLALEGAVALLGYVGDARRLAMGGGAGRGRGGVDGQLLVVYVNLAMYA
eukprot:COSAG02_NODE_24816_length_676_cov_8.521664_1_plen_78_part_10